MPMSAHSTYLIVPDTMIVIQLWCPSALNSQYTTEYLKRRLPGVSGSITNPPPPEPSRVDEKPDPGPPVVAPRAPTARGQRENRTTMEGFGRNPVTFSAV